MIIQQLYRYIFCAWEELSVEEIKEAPNLLQPFIKNIKFQAALKALKANKLYETLYGQDNCYEYYVVRDDEILLDSYAYSNGKYHYFKEETQENNFHLYKSLFHLFNLFEVVTNKSASKSYYSSNDIGLFSYKIMVFFGQESIERILETFEKYCIAQEVNLDFSVFNSLLNFNLGTHSQNESIDLQVWRNLTLEAGLIDNIHLFNIAHEIEAKLGKPPQSIEQAIAVAKSRKFENQDESPEFAKFCAEFLISEDLFHKSLSDDHSIKLNAMISIINQIPATQLDLFLNVVPEIEMDHNEMGRILKILSNNQSTFIKRFSNNLSHAITESSQLCFIFKHLANEAMQQDLVNHLSKEYVQKILSNTSIYQLCYFLHSVHKNYVEEFISNILGTETLQGKIKSGYDLNTFMNNALPNNNQVSFLQKTVGMEKIRALPINHLDIAEHLKYLNNTEKLVYLREIIGRELLNQSLNNNWLMLTALLNVIPKELRLTVMQEIIGLDGLRTIVPLYGESRAKTAIRELLPENQSTLFLELLPTDEEKEAKKWLQETKIIISTHPFTLGFMGLGYGGEEITLDDGSSKKVPKTVKQQWGHIKDAEKGLVSYTQAWDAVQKLGIEIKPTSGTLHYFFRATDTKDYYKNFSSNQTQQPK